MAVLRKPRGQWGFGVGSTLARSGPPGVGRGARMHTWPAGAGSASALLCALR